MQKKLHQVTKYDLYFVLFAMSTETIRNIFLHVQYGEPISLQCSWLTPPTYHNHIRKKHKVAWTNLQHDKMCF